MKILFAGLLAAMFVFQTSAQVSIELSQDQDQFLPSETIPLGIKITNRSGRQLHFGEEANWLTFNVESADGFVVTKIADVPVAGAFDLETSQLGIKRVDLQPYFTMRQPGRYKVTATLRIKDWGQQIVSAPKGFDVVTGAKLWSQDFGMMVGTNRAPEMRRYVLEQANYLKEQLRLYVQVSDTAESQVFSVKALGPMVSFSHVEAQVDRQSRLNVLWQTGAQSFSFMVVSPDGTVTPVSYYDGFFSRPRLTVSDATGDVVVQGGTLRPKPMVVPLIKSPDELPHTMEPPPAGKK